ncbi:M23 family metallopeptidase [Bartonella schoenbuchensis]|uniref:Virulence determinant n=1 Tax=Bartonella schoenbuchensis m07a TaxID=1094496 RepID=N6UGF4_9HYPH|nr:M23 family metallopeptidase [Bartonella schoenbuchensis]ENN91564.1 putative virulence determinant [Bartonella schoenbuchensis m07a]
MRYSLQGIVLWVVVTIITGCSSGTQRFYDGFYKGPAQSTTLTTMSDDPQMLSEGGVIQSSELPPVESPYDSGVNDSSYDSLEQGATSYSDKHREFSSDGRIMGSPPQNLGTLSRSQVNNPPTSRRGSYIVQSGDTLLSIARQIGVSVEALKLANGMNNHSIHVGQVLIIPDERTSVPSNAPNNTQVTSQTPSPTPSKVVSSVESKKDPSSAYGTSVTTTSATKTDSSNVKQDSSLQKPVTALSDTVVDSDDVVAPQATGISKMRWPVRGRLLSHFGQKKGTVVSRGIEITVPEGSSVKAAENGVVIYASDGLKELGNVVMIRHEDNIITIYGHNDKLVVSRGQKVRRGDEIAKSGVSGDATTPRVYFEVRKDTVPVDPIKYLEN